jgi:hypothetical protein
MFKDVWLPRGGHPRYILEEIAVPAANSEDELAVAFTAKSSVVSQFET